MQRLATSLSYDEVLTDRKLASNGLIDDCDDASVFSPCCSKLNLPLPHKVKHKEGNAKWDASKHELQVRVPVIRVDPF